MGRTIASITQTWHEEEAALKRFERALRKDDQILLDELLVFSRLHLAEASYASNLYPLDMYLIAILLEVYKKLKSLEKEVHGGKEEQAPELIKEARFLEMLEESFKQTLERPPQPQAVPVAGLGNGLGRFSTTVSLQSSEIRPQVIPVEADFAEEQGSLSTGSAAARRTAAAREKEFVFSEASPVGLSAGTEVSAAAGKASLAPALRKKGESSRSIVAESMRLSRMSTLSYPPCVLSDPAVAPSYANFEDAP